jgi:hypothetical protein
VAVGDQHRDELAADRSGRSGEEDAHVVILARERPSASDFGIRNRTVGRAKESDFARRSVSDALPGSSGAWALPSIDHR